jgi:hypothetical protein
MSLDLSALKDSKTTLPGLGLICLTILILAGKIPVELLLQKLPWDYIIGAIFGGGGIALLGANSNKSRGLPGGPAIPAPPPVAAPVPVPTAEAPPPGAAGFMRLSLVAIIGLIVLLLLLFGCIGPSASLPGASGQQAAAQDSARTTAYKTLASANKTYTAAMKSIADLYKQGIVDEAVKARAIEYGNAFKQAHDLAITAVEAGDYHKVAGVSAALANLLDFVQPYLIKGGAK